MASDREEKWKKYFASKEVETEIQNPSGFKTNIPADIYDRKGLKIAQLDVGTKITVPKAHFYNVMYKIRFVDKKGKKVEGFVNQNRVMKPKATAGVKGGTSDFLRVKAENLTQLGKLTTIKYMDHMVQVRYFQSSSDIAKSIVYGLQYNSTATPEFMNSVQNYFRNSQGDRIEWDESIPVQMINNMGTYGGEVLIGYYGLKNISQVFTQKFLNSKPKGFAIPTDPSFKMVDSFFVMHDNTIVPVSSKFGMGSNAGAAASFFSNLLPKAIENYNSLPIGPLKKICDTVFELNYGINDLERRGTNKEIVYNYGVRKILNLSYNDISNPIDIYRNLVSQKNNSQLELTDDTKKVLEKIKKSDKLEPQVKISLPFSTTAFFVRNMIKELSNDDQTLEHLAKIISGKDFWQANLDKTKWQNGIVKYNMIKTSEAKVDIAPSKGAIADIEMSQGMINYRIVQR
jgi:hypothetical protein